MKGEYAGKRTFAAPPSRLNNMPSPHVATVARLWASAGRDAAWRDILARAAWKGMGRRRVSTNTTAAPLTGMLPSPFRLSPRSAPRLSTCDRRWGLL